jgi:hypothetical protein
MALQRVQVISILKSIIVRGESSTKLGILSEGLPIPYLICFLC